ncbi:MAG TPA: helix-turn-helix domain-containing protein [Candidatus Paceibacterota bacterium]
MALKETLGRLGLHDKEISIFLALLRSGPATPAELSKTTKVNRATVYSVAQSLQSKGFVEADISGKSVRFSPISPASLEKAAERDRRALDEKTAMLREVAAEAANISAGKTHPVPKIRFVEEHRLEEFLYENIEQWQADVLALDGTWWGIQDYTFLEAYQKWLSWYWKQPFSSKTKMRLVGNDAPAERALASKQPRPVRDIKFSKDVSFSASVWVGGDRIVMIVTQQHPYYLVEINDRMLASNMREVFKRMWLTA